MSRLEIYSTIPPTKCSTNIIIRWHLQVWARTTGHQEVERVEIFARNAHCRDDQSGEPPIENRYFSKDIPPSEIVAFDTGEKFEKDLDRISFFFFLSIHDAVIHGSHKNPYPFLLQVVIDARRLSHKSTTVARHITTTETATSSQWLQRTDKTPLLSNHGDPNPSHQ